MLPELSEKNEFVKSQLKSKSPRTRKKAKEFVEKWAKNFY